MMGKKGAALLNNEQELHLIPLPRYVGDKISL